MRTILPKKHHNQGRIDRTADQVDIQDPPFQQRVQVEFHLFDGLGGQNHAVYTTFGYIIAASARTSNRPGGTLISAAKTAQQVEIEQVR